MNDQITTTYHNRSVRPAESGLVDLLAVLVRGKWIIVGSLLGALLLTAIAIQVTGPLYEANASVIINTRIAQSPAPLFSEETGNSSGQKIIQNELEILKSRLLAQKVATTLIKHAFLDTNKSVPILIIQPSNESDGVVAPLDVIINRLDRSVELTRVLESDVIRVRVKSRDPREAALIANTYAKTYHDQNQDLSRAKSRSIREYLQVQLREKQGALIVVEDSLKKYMEQRGVVSLDDEAKRTINQLSELKAARDAVDIQMRTLEQTLSSYQQQLSAQEKDFSSVIAQSNDPYIRLLQEQLAKLEVQRDMTATQNPTLVGQEIYGAKLKEIDDQILALRSKLQTRAIQFLKTILPSSEAGGSAQGPADYLNRIKQKILEAQIETQSLQAKRRALEEPIRQYEDQFERIPAKSLQYARLQRDKQSTEKLYLMLDDKFNQASLIEHSEFGSVDIFDPAVAPAEPSISRNLLIMLLGSLLGLGSGMALVFIREHFDPKVYHPQNLKQRGYLVLCTVGQMKQEFKRLKKRAYVRIKNKEIDEHIVTLTHPTSMIAESYRHMRTNLHFAKLGHPVQTILVTSSKPGEGKSTTVANLSVAFAGEGKKVLLIDADLRRPALHTCFALDPTFGLSDFLVGNTHDQIVVQKSVQRNLHIITCGTIPTNPSEILSSAKMQELMVEVKSQYDLILFDSSPVLAVTDPCVLSSLVDEVIIVAATGETRREELERTVELLREVRGSEPVVVLNNFNPRLASGVVFGQSRYGYHSVSHASTRPKRNGNGWTKSRNQVN